MSSQDELPGSDASAKTLTRSGILTPASDNSPNLSDGSSSGARKRKRDGNTMEDFLKDSFVVKVSTSITYLTALTHSNAALPFRCLR
jgi:DNA replication regulator SLD3